MKKVFLLMTFFIPAFVFADSGVSSVTWNDDIVDCGSGASHGVTHYGVPDTNSGAIASSGVTPCTTHAYYPASNHTVTVTANAGITACPVGERAITISPSPCTSGSCTMTCQFYDDTRPMPGDVSDPSGNLLAINSRNLSFTVGVNGGSPIVEISSFFEDYANPSGFLGVQTIPNNGTWSFNENIQSVDGADRQATGGRPYTLRVSKICDQAQNCTCSSAIGPLGYCATPATAASSADSIRDITYTVYANPSSTVSNTSTFGGAQIADGEANTFTHTIADEWGNDIIPASGVNRTISQNLSSVSNTMHLDQFSRSGGSSVRITPVSGSEVALVLSPTAAQSLGNQSSSNGSYPLNIRVYTPTANSYGASEPVSDPTAAFSFTSDLVVSDPVLGANRTLPRPLTNTSFAPLYVSAITGDLRNGGFIEGAIQDSVIAITKNPASPTSPTPGTAEFQLEFSGANANNFDFSANPPGAYFASITTAQSNFNSIPNLASQLYQKPGTMIDNLSNLYLTTHFLYSIGGISNIRYNSDTVGKSSFYDTTVTNSGSQYGVKIIGAVASNVTSAITAGQFDGSTSIFGGMNKATIRNNMNRSIALATRGMVMNSVGGSVTNLSSLPAGAAASGGIISQDSTTSIMKIEKNGGFITLGNGSNLGINGKRTLVIVGANLYISSDMYYANNNSIFGVVILKDENGNGGNLYIDPSVTNLVGTYVLDGSVQSSSDGVTAIGVTNITALKNQLYLFGSFISENTIGGSRMSTPNCPSLLNIGTCDRDTAQQYDLNYLRRYYLYNNTPFGYNSVPNTKIIGGETCDAAGNCTILNLLLKQKFTDTSSELAQYPVIIEHNPAISTNPPPGFDIAID